MCNECNECPVKRCGRHEGHDGHHRDEHGTAFVMFGEDESGEPTTLDLGPDDE